VVPAEPLRMQARTTDPEPGFWHWLMPGTTAEPVGYPVRSLVTVTSQVTWLAPPGPAKLHWLIDVIGVADVVVVPGGQESAALHTMVVTIVAVPVGTVGVAAL